MIVDAIKKEMNKARSRGWDKIYLFIDFHEIIIKPDYQSEVPAVDYYPFAKELLQYLTSRDDICLIAWTCSHPHQIEGYLTEMAKSDIKFNYVNENPEVESNQAYGCYDDKPYYNLMLDDKAGVMPSELQDILNEFKEQSVL